MQPCTDRARLPIAAEMRSARADAAAVDRNFQEHNKVCRVTERAWVSAVSAPLHVACKNATYVACKNATAACSTRGSHAARGVRADGSGAGKWMNRWRMRLGLWEYSEFSIGSHAG